MRWDDERFQKMIQGMVEIERREGRTVDEKVASLIQFLDDCDVSDQALLEVEKRIGRIIQAAMPSFHDMRDAVREADSWIK